MADPRSGRPARRTRPDRVPGPGAARRATCRANPLTPGRHPAADGHARDGRSGRIGVRPASRCLTLGVCSTASWGGCTRVCDGATGWCSSPARRRVHRRGAADRRGDLFLLPLAVRRRADRLCRLRVGGGGAGASLKAMPAQRDRELAGQLRPARGETVTAWEAATTLALRQYRSGAGWWTPVVLPTCALTVVVLDLPWHAFFGDAAGLPDPGCVRHRRDWAGEMLARPLVRDIAARSPTTSRSSGTGCR